MLVEQDAELGQLCQIVEQLREEKVKESGQADKLAEELKGEYFVVRVTGGVMSLLDGTLKCLQTILRGSRHSSMCLSRRLGSRGTSSTP